MLADEQPTPQQAVPTYWVDEAGKMWYSGSKAAKAAVLSPSTKENSGLASPSVRQRRKRLQFDASCSGGSGEAQRDAGRGQYSAEQFDVPAPAGKDEAHAGVITLYQSPPQKMFLLLDVWGEWVASARTLLSHVSMSLPSFKTLTPLLYILLFLITIAATECSVRAFGLQHALSPVAEGQGEAMALLAVPTPLPAIRLLSVTLVEETHTLVAVVDVVRHPPLSSPHICAFTPFVPASLPVLSLLICRLICGAGATAVCVAA